MFITADRDGSLGGAKECQQANERYGLVRPGDGGKLNSTPIWSNVFRESSDFARLRRSRCSCVFATDLPIGPRHAEMQDRGT